MSKIGDAQQSQIEAHLITLFSNGGILHFFLKGPMNSYNSALKNVSQMRVLWHKINTLLYIPAKRE